MANVHRVEIDGELPWDWNQNISAEDAKVLVAWFMDPIIGIKFEILNPGSFGNRKFQIRGDEAIWTSGVKAIADIFRKLGTVTKARCVDLEFSQHEKWFNV